MRNWTHKDHLGRLCRPLDSRPDEDGRIRVEHLHREPELGIERMDPALIHPRVATAVADSTDDEAAGFELRIRLGNTAMRGGRDIARALRDVADALEDEGAEPIRQRVRIRDDNGNTVGFHQFHERGGLNAGS